MGLIFVPNYEMGGWAIQLFLPTKTTTQSSLIHTGPYTRSFVTHIVQGVSVAHCLMLWLVGGRDKLLMYPSTWFLHASLMIL
jgi:hypothetical protein